MITSKRVVAPAVWALLSPVTMSADVVEPPASWQAKAHGALSLPENVGFLLVG